VSWSALVVDDDSSIREALKEYLEHEGHHAATASDGREALRILKEEPAPDVIVLDLLMPEMDGWDFRAAQMGIPSLAGIPVLVITATGFSAKTVMTQLHADGHLAKPLDPRTLVRALDRICHRSRPGAA
jgi:two-component system response regulator MprA